ncbi:cell adhesion molecule CEACAM1-like [Phyllobates terribilis]|uniref:cell adhesion molecule CEACAM1-like n=1 Tax=Phyllobates terribilis TaxID=111132 RepID=UPI003CCA72C4
MERTPRYPLIFPIFTLLVASGLVTPVISMEQVDGMLGHSVDFKIPITLPSQYRIDWNCGHTGKVIVIARLTSSGSPQYNPLYKGRTELMENGTLRLNNVSFADESTYKTKVFNPVTFNSYVQRYQLTIYSKLTTPALILNQKSPLISGTNVTLRCDAESQTVTSYTFYRDGQKIICSEPHVICRGSFLDFTSITEHESGYYTCTIQNPVSSNTSDSITVTVSVPVSSVTLTSNASELLWPGRDSVSLRCSARGTNVSYSWSREDTPLPENSRYHLSKNNSILIINQVSSADTKLLTCKASNWVNTETSNQVDFNFASPVSAVTLTSNTSAVLRAGEDSVSLHCSAEGSAITFSWRLNGEPVSQKSPYYITQSDSPPNSILTISPVSRNDTGPFTCEASNLLNSKTSNELNLLLNWYPEGGIACISNPYDTRLQIYCSWPGGQPAANVTMIFNNIATMGQNEVTRNVPFGQKIQKSSNLTCIGNHQQKRFSCTLIFGIPRLPKGKDKTVTAVTEGKN